MAQKHARDNSKIKWNEISKIGVSHRGTMYHYRNGTHQYVKGDRGLPMDQTHEEEPHEEEPSIIDKFYSSRQLI